MSLRLGIPFLQSLVLNNRTNSPYILRTSFRFIKDKNWNKESTEIEIKTEKDLSKVRVILKDEHGHIMGNKSLVEAKALAQKLRLNMIEDKDVSNHFKFKAFKLVSNKSLAQIDKDLEDTEEHNHNTEDRLSSDSKDKSSSAQTVREVKHLVFSTKLNENDLMTKIKQIKRWLSRGHHIAVNVTNPKNDRKLMDEIYTKFEAELKGFAKFNQKKIKNNNTLKFMIVTDVDTKEQLKNTTNDSDLMDEIENLDPNKLLSDEFEKQLETKK